MVQRSAVVAFTVVITVYLCSSSQIPSRRHYNARRTLGDNADTRRVHSHPSMAIRQRPGTGNQEHAAGYTGFTWRPASLERKHQTKKNAIKIRMLQDAAVPPNLTDGELNHFGNGSRPKWHLKILENYNFCIFLRPACKLDRMRRGNASDVGENFRVNQGPMYHTSSRDTRLPVSVALR
jgi:hypothetical protein